MRRQVLVTREKHGDFYYAADTDEELAESALKILTIRWNEGYWYLKPEEMFDDNSQYERDVLAKLIEGFDPEHSTDLKKQMISDFIKNKIEPMEALDLPSGQKLRAQLERAIKRENERQRYAAWYNDVKELVESQDVTAVVTYRNGRTEPKAWKILYDRSDHEYESVELEDLR